MSEPDRYVEVPYENIDPATLDRLLADVALRDDTDYGDTPRSLVDRIAMAREALRRGELMLTYDTETETVALAPGVTKNRSR